MAAKKIGFMAAMLLMGAMALPVMAQAGGGNGGGGGGGFGGGGGGGGGGFGGGGGGGGRGGGQARMMQMLQQQLAPITDDEFTALQPKIQAVMADQQDVGGGGMRGLFGRGGRGGGGGAGGGGGGGGANGAAAAPSEAQQAMTDLRTTLDDQNATPDQIKAKLDALRAARTKAKEKLAADQKDLQSVLTQRQEAVLVMFGMLE